MKRTLVLIAAVVVVASLSSAQTAVPSRAADPTDRPTSHPSVVVILVDDATVADVESMPSVGALIAAEGTTFARNYSADPICCPARVTILTGRYPHNHGVLDNVAPLGGFTAFDDSSTIATWLDPDYRTGMFGKYLNDNAGQRSYIPPGWDDFTTPTRHDTYQYVALHLWVNGTPRPFPGEESTSLYAKQARAFISRSVAAGDPFFAYRRASLRRMQAVRTTTTPHDPGSSPWVPPEVPRHRAANSGPTIRLSTRPTSRTSRRISRARPRAHRRARPRPASPSATRSSARLSRAVDDEVDGDRRAGSQISESSNDTYIVFASDNGYMDGQHRIQRGKGVAYEPASRVPLIVRGPGFPAGSTYGRVTGLQDIAPTILDVSGEQTRSPIDGVSLLRLVDGSLHTNRPQLIEIPMDAKLSDNAVQHGAHPSAAEARRLRSVSWYARGYVTSGGWKYIAYPQTGEVELYDLDADPFELDNLVEVPAYRARVAMMAARLRVWKRCAETTCR